MSKQEDNIEGALSWLRVWESTEPDDEEFKYYQENLSLIEAISKIKSKARGKNKTS